MPTPSTESTWLILEQDDETNRRDWNFEAGFCAVVSVRGVDKFSAAGLHVLERGAIYLLPLALTASSPVLPPAFTNAPENSLKVWCHYGRDVDLAKLPTAWTDYQRLIQADKFRLFPSRDDFPMAFSRSQPMAWTEDLQDAKKAVRTRDPDALRKGAEALGRAWEKAQATTRVHKLVDQLRAAMPAVLIARYLQGAFEHPQPDPVRQWKQFSRTFLASGLRDCVPRRMDFPEGSREEFRVLMHRIAQAWQMAHRSNVDASTNARDAERNNASIRIALEFFLATNRDESAIATRQLKRHPQALV